MENINFLENLAQRLGQTATVKNVYGDPVVAGDKTIIPVAQIIYGFGGGYGYGGCGFGGGFALIIVLFILLIIIGAVIWN